MSVDTAGVASADAAELADGDGGWSFETDVQPPKASIAGRSRTERGRTRTESMGQKWREGDPSASRGQGTVRTGSSWTSNDRPMFEPEPFLSQYVQLEPSRVNR